MNIEKFISEGCAKDLNPEVKDDSNENKDDINQATICYQTIYNYYVLSLIFDINIIWHIFKVLKADMGFRCTCSPFFTTFLQMIMAIVRIFVFFVGVVYYVLPYVLMHCIYSYIVIWKHLKKLITADNKAKQITDVSNKLKLTETFIGF